jgi:hypothetical protein
VDYCKSPFVSGVCLKEPFKLPPKTSEYAKHISHISLEFNGRDVARDLSFLENFTNSELVWLFGAKFNDNMLKTISSLQSMDHILLHKCEMGNYLPEITKIRHIKKFRTTYCIHTEDIEFKFFEQSTEVNLFGIDDDDEVDLTEYSNLSKL